MRNLASRGSLLFGGLMMFGCAPEASEPGAVETSPLVLFVALDTVRQDALGVYGTGDSNTPALDRFAEDCVVFENFGVPMPFTLPSHMSMFTGVSPGVHRLERSNQSLSTGIPTIGELLAAEGFECRGVVTNLWMKGGFGFDRGFDSYERILPQLTYAEQINQRAIELLEGRDPSRGMFLFLHYMDAHSDFADVTEGTLPYYSPSEYRTALGDAADGYFQEPGEAATDFLMACNQDQRELDPAVVPLLRELYAAGVRHLDDQLGKLFEDLKKQGLYDQALILVTSDHGEEFREHGKFIHAQPYEECIAVPLLIKFPGQRGAGHREPSLVEAIDLLPTLLEEFGVEVPGHVQGRSVRETLAGGPPVRGAILSRDKQRPARFALRTERFKVIHDLVSQHSELFDLEQDPGEQVDVASEHPDKVASLVRRIRGMVQENELMAKKLTVRQSTPTQVLTEEERETLRSLGYLED